MQINFSRKSLHKGRRWNNMAKSLEETIQQINIMSKLVNDVPKVQGHNIKNRAIGDLDRIANSAWLNLFEYLFDSGIDPDRHFPKKNG